MHGILKCFSVFFRGKIRIGRILKLTGFEQWGEFEMGLRKKTARRRNDLNSYTVS
ncbi:hypothetical protein BGS_0383 [Beggiatoa sp. SS]|nr:hypothetical protein BGS_0383 [Beggiatoa sp. SS]